jgi:hypothetical protein
VLLTACTWIDDEDGRLDQDGDGIPVELDCNDEDPEFSVLGGWAGELHCGDSVELDIRAGMDELRYINCEHPEQSEDLVWLGGLEQVFRLIIDTPTDVVMTLSTSSFLLPVDPRDTNGIGMLAFPERVCELQDCVVALPPAPEAYSQEVPLEDRESWQPSLFFHAVPGEPWHIVVSGGRGEEPSPYRLDVVCGS